MTTTTDRTAQPPAARPGVGADLPGRARWWARLSGAIAGLGGLGLADLIAWALRTPGSPVDTVGELIISLLPAPMIDFGKTVLGLADKPVLIGIVAIVALIGCGLGGQLEYWRRSAGVFVFGGLAIVCIGAVSALADRSPVAYLPTLVGLAGGYLILKLLITRLRRWQASAGHDDERGAVDHRTVLNRRTFLRSTLVLGAIGMVAAVGARALNSAATAVSSARSRLPLPKAAQPAPPIPAGADLKINNLAPYIVPNDDFYRIDTALQVPRLDPETWELSITGMVAKPYKITMAEVLELPLREHVVTLTCVSNVVGGSLVGNALWLGYPIRELLERAEPMAGADMVLSRSADGWTAGTPLPILQDPDREALLAVGMNGESLPIEHGFPARLVVPGLYGYVSATKWVIELKVTTFADDYGYWTPLGWSALGPIKTQSRIDTPTRTIDTGPTMIAGVAWAQHTGIRAVEVRIDDNPWKQAKLAEVTGPDTWRQWSLPWDPAPGEHTLAVRATDESGYTQTDALAAPAPDGATGWHTVQITVRG